MNALIVPTNVDFIIRMPSVKTAMSCVFCAIYSRQYQVSENEIDADFTDLIAGIQLCVVLDLLLLQSRRHLDQILGLIMKNLSDILELDKSKGTWMAMIWARISNMVSGMICSTLRT